MDGAAEKWKAKKALVWWGAMLPHIEKPPSLEQFSGYVPDKKEALKRWLQAWDKVDAGLKRKRNV
jgi:hypothetical protein